MRQSKSNITIRYSEAFKQKVVSEVECGELSVNEAMRRYGITGKMTIYKWLRRFGRNQQTGRMVRVETQADRDMILKLKEENRLLRDALSETQLQKLCSDCHLEAALGQLSEEQKKTVLSKLSPAQRRLLERGGLPRP